MADRATREQLVEKVARAMFDAWPMHAVSPALAEKAGVPIGTPLTWDQVIEMGGDHNGLLRLARAAIASLSPPNEGMREALEEARETIMRVAYSDHPLRPGENYGSRKARIDRLLAKIDAALSRTGEAGLEDRLQQEPTSIASEAS